MLNGHTQKDAENGQTELGKRKKISGTNFVATKLQGGG